MSDAVAAQSESLSAAAREASRSHAVLREHRRQKSALATSQPPSQSAARAGTAIGKGVVVIGSAKSAKSGAEKKKLKIALKPK